MLIHTVTKQNRQIFIEIGNNINKSRAAAKAIAEKANRFNGFDILSLDFATSFHIDIVENLIWMPLL